MSLRILLRDHAERSIAVVTDTHALIFRHGALSPSYPQASKSPTPRCMVEFSAIDTIDLADYSSLHPSGAYGTLGLINVNADVFICVITGAVPVAVVRPGEHVQRIISVDFHCLNKAAFDHDLHDGVSSYEDSDSVADARDSSPTYNHRDPLIHPCIDLKKLLSDGTFYYSVDFDLTNRLQDRFLEESAFDVDTLDDGFLWNSYMIDPLIQFRSRLIAQDRETLDASRILTSAIRGYVSTIKVPTSSAPIKAIPTKHPSSLTLISRLSCRRAGTRFNARGIDDDGNVANFVETETIFWFPSGLCFSFAQIRGSVPIFWEQAAGLLPNQQKIQVTRSPEATQPAFDKHFEELELTYGSIYVLNLLSESKPGEVELTERYKYHVRKSALNNGSTSDQCQLKHSQFDFHAETKGPSGYEAASSIRNLIQNDAERFEYHLSHRARGTDIQNGNDKKRDLPILQRGTFRTNCLDCLDRTNLIQTIISQMALESFLRQASPDFWMRHSSLWADNGDALSKIYAGTGALKSSFTRHGKMSIAGAIADARKSATRMYINNFVDKGRQNTIDILLGRLVDRCPVQLYDPINDYVNTELHKMINEYSSSEEITIWVGSFNLNGRGHGVKEDLSAWLCPEIDSSEQPADIVAVGFQEIVELSPQQIMSTDPLRRQEWERAVAKTLNENARRHKSEEYVLLRSGQLVGAALMVFVKSHVLKAIKNVEGSTKKTGLSGMAGNKGAVAIRMEYANTRICFVTAHLAAGFANYDERNKDYHTISHGLRFQRNRLIEDHDTIIWLGDFNYRIGLNHEKVHQLIKAADIATLYQNDQLYLQMVAGYTFPFYSEASITFLPTYKYDNGTDVYDTSEKARIPAWCDRVLRKGANLRQIDYNTAPLCFSDHRPVYATFRCMTSRINGLEKENLRKQIYSKRRKDVGDTGTDTTKEQVDDEDLLGYNSIAPGLPPASSDRRKWWLNNGLPASSSIIVSHDHQRPNPHRTSNPFLPSSESDWVATYETSKPRSQFRPEASDTIHNKVPSKSSYRELTPFNPNRRLSLNLGHVADSISGDGHMSPERTANTAPFVSSSAEKARKPAPPVPRKPTSLISHNNLDGTLKLRESTHITSPSRSTKDGSIQSISTTGVVNTPPLPYQVVQRSTRTISDLSTSDNSILGSRRPLPNRATAPTTQGSNAIIGDDLLGEDDDSAQSIPSLQPLRTDRGIPSHR